jgi:hypothetical protein
MLGKIGNWYFKYLYRNITRVTSKISDATDCAISDVLLGPSLFVLELFAAWMVFVLVNVILADNALQVAEAYSQELVVAIISIGGIVCLTYMFNHLRVPAHKRLGLEPADLDQNAEVSYVVKQLNNFKHEPLKFQQVNNCINQAMNQFVWEFEGLDITFSQKTKKSLFSKWLLRSRSGGMLNPFIQEVVVTTELVPEAIAHEKAHLVGYSREVDAQLVGYRMLMRFYQCEVGDIEVMGLTGLGLKQLKEREQLFKQLENQGAWYGKVKRAVGRAIRSGMLRLLGQKGVKAAYVAIPLSLISAYDPPQALVAS